MSLNFSAIWLICFCGGSLIMGLVAWSCAFRHGLPILGVGAFLLWLVLFTFIVLLSSVMTRPARRR